MKTTPKVNRKLLRKIRDMIAKRPRQFLMDAFFDSICQTGEKASHCGTAACIAGWAIVLGRKAKDPAHAAQSVPLRNKAFDVGAKLLGLSQYQAGTLFSHYQWPEPFYARLNKATTPRAAANAAVARINHFLKTGE
jgi:hypothetical protein